MKRIPQLTFRLALRKDCLGKTLSDVFMVSEQDLSYCAARGCVKRLYDRKDKLPLSRCLDLRLSTNLCLTFMKATDFDVCQQKALDKEGIAVPKDTLDLLKSSTNGTEKLTKDHGHTTIWEYTEYLKEAYGKWRSSLPRRHVKPTAPALKSLIKGRSKCTTR